MLKDEPRRFDSALAVAEHLSISVRTLHRHFAEHDASFYQLKDEVRRDLALDLLHGTNKSIKQIALSLGFANEKSFYRTFLKWTGDPPGKIRQRELL